MKSLKIYLRCLKFLKPFVFLFIIAGLISSFVVMMDGISLWLLGSLPKVLFDPSGIVIHKPELSLNTINEYLKYYSYRLLSSHDKTDGLMLVCAGIVILYTLKNFLNYISKIITNYLNLGITYDMRNFFYRQLLLLPISFFDRNKSGKIVALLINDLNQINSSITGAINNIFIEPLRLLFFISMLLIINIKLTIVVFIIYPLLALIIMATGKSVRRRIKRELDSFAGMFAILTETVSGIRLVKMFNMNVNEYTKFQTENNSYRTKAMRSAKIRELQSPLTECMAVYVTAILLWYGGSSALAMQSSFTAEDFFRFLFFLLASYQPIKALGNANNSIQAGIGAGQRVFYLLSIEPEPLIESARKEVPSFQTSIAFNNVSFSYPGFDQVVLNNVSFSVKKGEILAIVGSSGAGKSTILDLLPRFYDIDKGSITIDNVDIRTMPMSGLRELFGIVSQETILFNDTVRANICYGTAQSDDQEILNAAKAANALEFIRQLPEGLDTTIGDKGVLLSGGQRQRLSIARALLRNPQILILDEATSSLDTESEKLVQTAIDTLLSNRTSFVVAHRLSTIQHAGRVIVLDKGVIVETGTHAELLNLGQRYKYFYDIQFSRKEPC
jgi:subfamily B ATP-binding cassette protein MsbA